MKKLAIVFMAWFTLAGHAEETNTLVLSEEETNAINLKLEAMEKLLIYSNRNLFIGGSQIITNGIISWCEWLTAQGTLTNAVKELVAKGHVCAVIGHVWEFGSPMPGCLVLYDGRMRHCRICKKTQSQKPGEWED